MVLLLIFGFSWLEYEFLKSRPEVRRFLKHHSKLQILASIGLSWLVGQVFPAIGATVLIAGIISTVLMNTVWKNYEYVEMGETWLTEKKADLVAHKEEYKKTAVQVANGARITFKVAMFPFKMIGMAAQGINTAKTKFQNTRTRVDLWLGGKR